ncbi:hypothetical protein BJV78DRAFT_1153923 [Lactifluus subvellereus]|nr:hypothetical protein BJV78DRAFT_1153923 [Lactifluus subvellereus]
MLRAHCGEKAAAAPSWQMTTAHKSPRAWGILFFNNNNSGTTGTASRSSALALQQQGGGAALAPSRPQPPGGHVAPRRRRRNGVGIAQEGTFTHSCICMTGNNPTCAYTGASDSRWAQGEHYMGTLGQEFKLGEASPSPDRRSYLINMRPRRVNDTGTAPQRVAHHHHPRKGLRGPSRGYCNFQYPTGTVPPLLLDTCAEREFLEPFGTARLKYSIDSKTQLSRAHHRSFRFARMFEG